MSYWTDETRASVIEMYKEAEPTPETSMEVIKDIAEKIGQSANGVRMVLVTAGVYVKKDPTATPAKEKAKPAAEGGTKRVSKEDSHAALKAAIVAAGKEVDEDIVSKLTGKAAIYFTEVLTK